MTAHRHINGYLAFLLIAAGTAPLPAQTIESNKELKLNEEAVRLIQFDFTPKPESQLNKLLEAPMEKRWMKFKEDRSMPRSLTDTSRVRKPESYVRAEPYTIWTRFGEDPVYDVIPGNSKKWVIRWTLNPFGTDREEYGRNQKPSPGRMYNSVGASAGLGAIMEVDFDKLLYESLTKRGRAIRHNRKHANAWKTYADYVPTQADSLKFPTYRPVLSVYASDSLLKQGQQDSTKETPLPRPTLPSASGQRETETESSFSRYVRQRAAEDSIRRKEYLRKDKARNNVYDVEKQIRRLKEQ